jgi:hypothetical protein
MLTAWFEGEYEKVRGFFINGHRK